MAEKAVEGGLERCTEAFWALEPDSSAGAGRRGLYLSWTPMTFLSTPTMSCRASGERKKRRRAGAVLQEQRVEVASGLGSLGQCSCTGLGGSR